MAESIPQVWEDTLHGVKSYGEYGPRDALIIVSSESLEGPDIVPRKKGELTQEDKDRLTSQGIPPETWDDEAKLVKARYLKESRISDSISIESDPHSKKGHVMNRITTLFNNSTKPGVAIRYIGPGRRHTGDWCFRYGFITFEDITHLYIKHFVGKTLSIHSDCSYSGQWVQACKEFLDTVDTQPCGHSARKTGMLLKVCASCQPDQISTSLMYSARGEGNDKNTGALFVYLNKEIGPNQKICGIDFTKITCKKSLDEECALSPDFTFHKQKDNKRIFHVTGVDKGRKAWHYVLLVDDPETIRIFKEKTQGKLQGTQDINMNDYGVVLKSGFGEEPPQEVKDWLDRILTGFETLRY